MFEQMFNEIHVNRKAMRSPKEVSKFIEELDLGVDAESFEKAMTSFSVETGMRRSMAMAKDAQVSGVPSLMVNGKFMTSASLAGGNEGMIRVISQLAEQEHKAS
jgi:thiol:disulfide interchange protein DsbA